MMRCSTETGLESGRELASRCGLVGLTVPGADQRQFGYSLGMSDKVVKSDAEWHEQLDEQQYHVTRQGGTERAFTGKYWNNKEDGTYDCVCCGATLFASDTKYNSGSGWPSFTAPANPELVAEHTDTSYGMVRTEVTCNRCDAHLGHVFPDGPGPDGLRYCINSASLDFKKD